MKTKINQYVQPLHYGIPQLRYLLHRHQFREACSYIFIDFIWRWFQSICTIMSRQLGHRSFQFDHKKYSYCVSRYNQSWANERAVEVPIGLKFLQQKPRKSALEVGCVLPHYIKPTWTVLDKFETGHHIINQDLFNYQPTHLFDRIICISTIEHIGVDDTTNNPKLGIKAIAALKALLAVNGELLITIPMGYNPVLDKYLLSHPNIFTQSYGLKRTTVSNQWQQVPITKLQTRVYGWPYNNANGVFIGYYQNTL